MTLRTAKHSLRASTFAALAASQATMQGSFAAIEIGEHTVDVSSIADSTAAYAAATLAELTDALTDLRAEAGAAGDAVQVALVDAAMTGDVGALELCCEALAAAQG